MILDATGVSTFPIRSSGESPKFTNWRNPVLASDNFRLSEASLYRI